MNILHDISPDRITPDDFIAVIEISKGSKIKYELDKATGMLMMDRILHTSTRYPASYGFIPRTLADDGDPLDVMVLCSEELHPMTLVRCYPIGMLKMIDGGKRDEKIIAIPIGDPNFACYHELSELPRHMFDEMQHFLTVYKALEHKETAVDAVNGTAEALAVIGETIARYREAAGV